MCDEVKHLERIELFFEGDSLGVGTGEGGRDVTQQQSHLYPTQ